MSSPLANLDDPSPRPAQTTASVRCRRPVSRLLVGGAAALLLLCFVAAGLLSRSLWAPSLWPPSAIKLTSVEVADRYSKDEFAADRDLTGKVLEITGRFGSSYSDMVVIETPQPHEAPTPAESATGPESLADTYNRLARASIRATGPHVAASSTPPVVDIVCKLKRGVKGGAKSSTATLRGVCKGRDAPHHLVLEECELVSP